MAFTRFNYDELRTAKLLQESTGPGRYMLNTPGFGQNPYYFEESQVRLQQWGANLRDVPKGQHPIDIDSELIGLNKPLTKMDCNEYNKDFKTTPKKYKDATFNIDETRASHPAFLYRDLEQTRWEHPLIDPQTNLEIPFKSYVNSTYEYNENYVPKVPKV